jgi:uncharacterized protein
MKDLNDWEIFWSQQAASSMADPDPAHDLAHLRRVVASAKLLCAEENANLEVVVPAAWFHDFVNIPKNDPRRTQASLLSADAAIEFLRKTEYPSRFFAEIHHAIQAHSYSAGGMPETPEAAIVQDADRLDALGAIGIARCFSVGGMLGRPLADGNDPFALKRPLNDQRFTLDHFYVKLLKLPETFRTQGGRTEAARRATFMKEYLTELQREFGLN